MTYEFLAEAREDLFQAVFYHEEIEPGLGLRLRNEVYSAIQTVVGNPFAWRERKRGYRRFNLAVFPYYLAYLVDGDLVLIVAVAHAARRPNYWIGRL